MLAAVSIPTIFLGARFARRSEEVIVALSAIGVPLLVLGGTFFTLEIMLAAMQTVALLELPSL